MMKEAKPRSNQGDAMGAAGILDFVFSARSAGLNDDAHTLAPDVVDAVSERDIPIGHEADIASGRTPLLSVRAG